MIAAELGGGSRLSLDEALGWIGSRVDDLYGVGVGRLEDIWIDPGTGIPRWLLVKEGRLTVVENIELEEIKTKKLVGVLQTLQVAPGTLVVDDKGNQNLRLSLRNLPKAQFLPPEGVNVYDLLRHEHLLLSRDAAKALEARCLGGKS